MQTSINSLWPELKYEDWKDTCHTLHRWMQMVGKIRLSKSPWLNHSWNATFYLTAQGLTTSVIHDVDDPSISFTIAFDFIRHALRINSSDGKVEKLKLVSEPVASFHAKLFGALRDMGIDARIVETPNEVLDAIPFPEDTVHRAYDPEFAHRFWLALLQSDRVMKEFRTRFVGKASPVHFFWGSQDLAVTRFSGRRAPEHPGGFPHLPDLVTREAYSHEVSSCGFWPGNELLPYPAFYSYAYPMPPGFEKSPVRPGQAFFHDKLREFILPYDAVRTASNPDQALWDFLQSTYEAAANLGKWDRSLLEESVYLKRLQRTA